MMPRVEKRQRIDGVDSVAVHDAAPAPRRAAAAESSWNTGHRLPAMYVTRASSSEIGLTVACALSTAVFRSRTTCRRSMRAPRIAPDKRR